MPLHFGELFNDISERICGADSIFNSPIWTAVILVGIIIIIVWFFLNEAHCKTPIFKLLVKIAIWCFISTAAILVLHNRAVSMEYRIKYSSKSQENIIKTATRGESSPGNVTPIFAK